jgi:hypothetical protein
VITTQDWRRDGQREHWTFIVGFVEWRLSIEAVIRSFPRVVQASCGRIHAVKPSGFLIQPYSTNYDAVHGTPEYRRYAMRVHANTFTRSSLPSVSVFVSPRRATPQFVRFTDTEGLHDHDHDLTMT